MMSLFQHTAARRRLRNHRRNGDDTSRRFNTQPREGGCVPINGLLHFWQSFNTQPREGGCRLLIWDHDTPIYVSTHSRAKAAA